jgi:hypothetical protein
VSILTDSQVKELLETTDGIMSGDPLCPSCNAKMNGVDPDNDGDMDILSTITPDYGGYVLQLHENKGGKKFVDVTKDKITGYIDRYDKDRPPSGSFANFYNIRLFDKDNDGDLDIVPDAVAIWGMWTTPLPTNLYWENQGGKFVRKQ